MDLLAVKAPRQRSMVSWEQQRMWKKWTYKLSRHPCRDPWSAGNNKECGRNGLTYCQGTQAEIHGQLGTTKNVEEMDLHSVKAPRQRSTVSWEQQSVGEMYTHTVKAPRQRSMVSWEQQRMWKKWTYLLSRHPGRDPWSAGNNKECGRNGLTACRGTQAEIHSQLGTTKNVEEMDLLPVKAPRHRSTVSWEQQRMWKKQTYSLSRHPGRDL